ncbi:hypothetical protein [Streptomyces sp. NPDC055912]|uniref:hypothetical protein n=1 Tax=unclassified Streptomyces TaxID=2593676 RepID=UPI0035DA3D18
MRVPGLGWLAGGNDPELASSTYAGRESATDRAAANRRSKALTRRAAEVRQAGRAAEAWEAEERRRTR